MSSTTFNPLSIFWIAIGILIGVATTLAFSKLWRHSQDRVGYQRATMYAAVAVAMLTAVSVGIYGILGRPDLIAGSTPPAAHATTAANADTVTSTPQSMEAATAQLAERLARDGGNDSDWQLLAQSYEFMGRSEAAARARKQVVTHSTPNAAPKPSPLLATANAARLKRNYAQARTAYEIAIKANAMTADSWADYADVLASSTAKQGATTLVGAPAQAIEQALALNPDHTKALWLKASLAHEEHRYAAALQSWQRLRSLIGDNESDARIIDANIAEAQQLADAATASKMKPTEITGTIEIDPKLLARATTGATLFIFAKTDSPGPPLAVFRTTVGKWPVSFKLDDSMAMMPSRTLSSATNVIVEARISHSGQATATTGDLQAAGARVKVGDGKAVRLRIDKVVS